MISSPESFRARNLTTDRAAANVSAAQAAQGHSLNASLQEPLQLMNTYLDEAANALNSGDAAAAKKFKDRAELMIERLEKMLNR